MQGCAAECTISLPYPPPYTPPHRPYPVPYRTPSTCYTPLMAQPNPLSSDLSRDSSSSDPWDKWSTLAMWRPLQRHVPQGSLFDFGCGGTVLEIAGFACLMHLPQGKAS
eukprot:352213-Chlamydomonas_euryale.AAC.1